ncbi:proline dehydrogenase [Pullulanibacillus pueri]|uniref:proline dehydrogenase n=1 Tax=Pullulanibacillus pueri TaxID=1437324 RepID=A0A8J2ZY93_9BACL|nr:proline dehydrogenase [Pullulanibacillus pueri]MBM7682852.1 proline dehydrogenase [Pullulanibacillus pueri]GGH84290.1 proline dehydrogenase [Pullulanibacillus pueri]
MEQLLRNFFLFLGKNRRLTVLAKKYGMMFGASRFVAGATLEGALKTIHELNAQGFSVTIDHLGEFVDNEREACDMADHCIQAIEAIADRGLDSQLSLKLTSMGLDIDRELAISNMHRILKVAQKRGVFITIDMEDEPHCQITLDIFKELRAEYDNIGTVVQAYLYRTVDDLQDLNPYHPNLRIVKGAYKEPPEVAFPDKRDVDENYKNLVTIHLLQGNYTAIATHDEAMIQFAKKLVAEHQVPKDRFEFQMLYGIRPERQKQIVEEGYKMRIYVPYGEDWYGYNMRRLAERPANVAFVLKGMLKRK